MLYLLIQPLEAKKLAIPRQMAIYVYVCVCVCIYRSTPYPLSYIYIYHPAAEGNLVMKML
jgi:hypothetical protein